MEVLTGTVISKNEPQEEAPVKEVELFTNPVAVHRIRLSFGAVPVIQLLLTAVCGGALWYMQSSSAELQTMAEGIIRRFIGG